MLFYIIGGILLFGWGAYCGEQYTLERQKCGANTYSYHDPKNECEDSETQTPEYYDTPSAPCEHEILRSPM